MGHMENQTTKHKSYSNPYENVQDDEVLAVMCHKCGVYSSIQVKRKGSD